ncbi:extracellular solute-binding protein [Plantibacter sp. MCCC 1A11337]|uniref:ABC transporter substrate-binding protein n=1 Tax=Plantibacter TaxID=190323 RepID=UPI0007D934BD|nr:MULTISPECIES: extracellular solute-binding protein [unclassified Plantibacter]NUJ88212.1 extracellular solute-binding protein [Plantibacter sp. MCCC 1A11337]OAN30722.1 sugar ABC transporter substrate-binding protein [Plantibacter sp. H53]OII40062.1 sugar ABC transporter substrate-binding protein [Plantibacter sp. MMLR14_011]
MRSTLRHIGIATVATTALLLSGCSASSGGTESGPVKLTYWAWAPNLEQVVELWNEDHPDIQVVVQKQDGGDPAITKLLTAIKAGSGAPDLIQAEYQKIPTLVASDALADISKQGAADLKDDFSDGVWNSVTLGGDAVYAVPQDSGPMMAYYRTDILDSLGLSVPTTWDEYAQVARAVHQADPTKYLGTFSANDAGWFAGLAQQAGASWWSIDGDSWGVDIDAGPTEQVASYWGGLVEEGAIDNKPMYTPEWNAGLNDGSQVGWISSVWAPGVLGGNAPDTAGKWTAAELPQWDASKPSNGNWGGSSTAVTTQSKHAEAAVEFATWLNTDPKAVAALADVSGVYPAATKVAADALKTSPEFFSQQSDFYDIASKASETVAPFTYGPNVNVAFSAYNDEFAKAAEAKTAQAFSDAVAAMQSITIDDLKKSGFSVK